MRALVLVLSLLGCAAQEPPAAPPLAREKSALPPPVPARATVRLEAEDAGKTIGVRVGQTIAVSLRGIPTAGYIWRVAEKPAALGEPKEYQGDTVREQSKPGYTGGEHWETFAFEVTASGEGALRLVLARPWETNEPPSETFAVTIRAAP